MPSQMLRILRMLFTLTTGVMCGQFVANSQMTYSGPQQLRPEKAMILSQINKSMEQEGNEYMAANRCKYSPSNINKVQDGISIVPYDPVSEQLMKVQKQQKCLQTKIEADKEMKHRINKAVQEEITKSRQESSEIKPTCVKKLDTDAHDCYVNGVIEDIYKTPVWRIAIHNNVSELWYKDKLVYMIIYEQMEYKVTPEQQQCYSFFPSTNLSAEENALGHVVKVVGKPNSPNKRKSGSCRPCSDFLNEDYKTTEGKGRKCSNTCDPLSAFLEPNGFSEKKTTPEQQPKAAVKSVEK